MRLATRPLGLAFAVTLAVACGSPRTAVVVVVRTDMAVPEEISSVRAEVGDGGCAAATCIRDFAVARPDAFPFSFAIEPGPVSADTFVVTVTARDGGGRAIAVRRVRSSFVRGRTVRLVIDLSGACRAVECAIDSSCVAGACAPDAVDPGALVEVIPGHELDGLADAGPPLDASADAPRFDAPRDAPLERIGSCRALDAAAPSGAYAIDPDGAGGREPFEAWCENDLDGGGWTLLLKAVPDSPNLGYDGAWWTNDMVVGSPDESTEDAVLAPFYALPVDELRIATDVGAVVVMLPAVTTLDALVDGAPTRFVGTVDLAPLVPELSSAIPACPIAGINVGVPVAAPELRVRIGVAAASDVGCTSPIGWVGVGVAFAGASSCTAATIVSGGARVCGPAGLRREHGHPVRVYGR